MFELNQSRAIAARPRAGCFPVLFLLAGLLLAGAAHANTFTVTNLLDGAPGSLRACIAAAQSGADTINFQAPAYGNQTITIPLTNELDITTNLTITGLGAGVLTISGQNHSRVFNIAAGATVAISQLTISNGLASGNPGQGGGILNAGNLTLQNCIVTGNSAVGLPGGDGDGGGIYSSGPLMLQNCTISGNSANGGSGGNGIGGGIYSAIKLSLVNCLVSSNNAANGNGPAGGGIEAEVSLAMTNCTISFNSINNGVIGPAGGGIDISGYGTNGTIVNCTIASNSVTGGDYNPTGAGIQISDGNCILICCTICGNSAGSSSYGGGIAINGITGAGCTILNTIVSGNTDAGHSPDLDQGYLAQITHFSGGFNLIGNDAGAENVSWLASDQVGTSAQPIDPYLGPLQDNGGPTPTMAPTVLSSLVIDQGYSFGLTTDQRGRPRPFFLQAYPILSKFHGGDGSDIGAVELSYVPVLTITNSGLNQVVVSLLPDYTLNPLGPPDFGIHKILNSPIGLHGSGGGGGGKQLTALFKYPMRMVDHNYKIKDDMTDTDGVPTAIAFYEASTAVTNPYVPPPVTGPAINITSITATLTGTNYPAGSNTVYWFDYGMDTNYGSSTVTNGLDISTNPTPVSVDISGLTASTTYHYQLMASDSDLPGLQYGGDQQFTTAGTATLPGAVTLAASAVTGVNAQLNGTVNPNGADTTWFFEYGYDTTYSLGNTASGVVSAANTSAVPVNILAGGLNPLTTYHCQLVASNSAGISLGGDQQFTTPGLPPDVTTLAANPVGTTTATLNGTVNGEGSATAGYFQYGPAAGVYTNDTSGNQFYGPANYSPQSESTAISGLIPNTTYHYRILAYGASESFGADMSFTTAAAAQTPPSVTTSAASSVTTSSAVLNGSVDPNGADTMTYFEWGTDTSYGNFTTQTDIGTTPQSDFQATLNGLNSSTTYHYRIDAVNSGGTTLGSDVTFTTAWVPVPPNLVSPGTSTDTGYAVNTTQPTFTWVSNTNAASYGIVVTRYPAGTVVYQNTGLVGNSFQIPSGYLFGTEGGVKYSWTMTAFNSLGAQSASSAPLIFTDY
ncbi:MAG: fibronectin type III domain-containing protein [Verrucomicrobiia bacterium]